MPQGSVCQLHYVGGIVQFQEASGSRVRLPFLHAPPLYIGQEVRFALDSAGEAVSLVPQDQDQATTFGFSWRSCSAHLPILSRKHHQQMVTSQNPCGLLADSDEWVFSRRHTKGERAKGRDKPLVPSGCVAHEE